LCYGRFARIRFRALNSIIYYTIFKSPGTNNSGVFYFIGKEKDVD